MTSEIGATLSMAAPVALTQLSNVTMNLVDTWMVAPLGEVQLAAVGLGTALYFAPSILLIGTVAIVGPVAAQRHGAGDRAGVRQSLSDGWWIALAGGLVGTLGLLLFASGAGAFTPDAQVARSTGVYLAYRALALTPTLLFIVYRCFLEGQGRPAPGLWITVAANVVNALANWIFIYGRLGAPALGIGGAGLATFLSCLFQWICLAGYVHRADGVRAARPSLGGARALLRVGLPMGLHQALEVSIFAAAAVMMQRFGPVAAAAHQIAIQLATTTFMVAVGCSVAASTRVGQALGRGDVEAANRAGWLSIGLGVVFMSGTAVVFLTAARPLVAMFQPTEAVLEVAVRLLYIAGAFQVFDGIQAVASGALRGAGDTRFPLYASLAGYWGVGLPACLLLGFTLGLGPAGLWWGLTGALAAAAAGLMLRWSSGGWKGLERL
jgi:multidrug resistance protein, MATE family